MFALRNLMITCTVLFAFQSFAFTTRDHFNLVMDKMARSDFKSFSALGGEQFEVTETVKSCHSVRSGGAFNRRSHEVCQNMPVKVAYMRYKYSVSYIKHNPFHGSRSSGRADCVAIASVIFKAADAAQAASIEGEIVPTCTSIR